MSSIGWQPAGGPRRAPHIFFRRLSLAALRHLPLRFPVPRTRACWMNRHPFLDGPSGLCPEEESYYDLPNRSQESATLYQPLRGARIEHGLKFGEPRFALDGLPAIWNDGMNLVGKEGPRAKVSGSPFFFTMCSGQFVENGARASGREFSRSVCLAEAKKFAGKTSRKNAWGRPVVSGAPYFDERRTGSARRTKPRMPDRFAAAKLVGDQRRRRSPTLASSP